MTLPRYFSDRPTARTALTSTLAALFCWPAMSCGGNSQPSNQHRDGSAATGGTSGNASGGRGVSTGSGGTGGNLLPGTGGSGAIGTGGRDVLGTGGGSGPGSGGAGTGTGGGGPGSGGLAGGAVLGTGGRMGAAGGGPVGTGGGSAGGAAGGTGGSGGSPVVSMDARITGPLGDAYEYRVHHPFRLTVDGPMSSDSATPNPFLDYRLVVHFRTPSGKMYAVPGYFAGDGNFGGAGNKWRVHFNPPEVGAYSYTVEFHSGAGVAVVTGIRPGTALPPDGLIGSFSLAASNKMAPDFRATGKLAYTRQHYLHTIGDGRPWIKTGSNSPENLLGYVEFSNTTDGPGGGAVNFLHAFAPHVADWNAGDPTWNNGKGKGIIGVMNYYASVGVNSIGFIGQNLNGDGNDTIPWVSRTDRTHFDNTKLQEWEVLFSHMDTKGIAFQNFLSEMENWGLLGLNTNGRVFYHEMIARFAHHGGVMWNVGEESGYSDADKKGIAAYLMAIDPYKNPVGCHTLGNASARQFPPLFGDPNIVLGSMQDMLTRVPSYATQFRADSASGNVPWVVMYDEQTPAGTGVSDCPAPGMGNCDAVRRTSLWPFLMAGGGGVEWYMGYDNSCTDLNCENLRSRDALFKYARYARELLERLPLDEMSQANNLVSGGGLVWRKAGAVYAVYLPTGGTQTLNLAGETGLFRVRFFNVVNGTYGPATMVAGGGSVSLGAPPFTGDVAAVIEKM